MLAFELVLECALRRFPAEQIAGIPEGADGEFGKNAVWWSQDLCSVSNEPLPPGGQEQISSRSRCRLAGPCNALWIESKARILNILGKDDLIISGGELSHGSPWSSCLFNCVDGEATK